MIKREKVLLLALVIFFLGGISYAEERITLSTFYPAPYGEYDSLVADELAADSMAIGTTYAIPASNGYLVVEGRVGIGTQAPAGTLDVNGGIFQRGGVLHADYVFEEGYQLESIEEHSDYMWQERHLKAVPKVSVDENGIESLEIGAHRKGILEELEIAHLYIEQLNERIKALEAKVK